MIGNDSTCFFLLIVDWRSSLTTVAMDFICVVLPVLLIFTVGALLFEIYACSFNVQKVYNFDLLWQVLADWVYIFALLLLVLLLICIISRRYFVLN